MQLAHRRNHGERKERLHRQITRRHRVCFRVRRQRNVVRRYGNEPHGAHDAQLAFRRPDASQEQQRQEAGVPDLQIWKHKLFPSGTSLARRRNENNQHRDLDGLGFRIPNHDQI